MFSTTTRCGQRCDNALGPADALRLVAEASEIPERLSQGGTLDHAWAAVLRAAGQAGSVAAYCDSAVLGATPGEAEAEVEAMDAVQVMTLHRAKGLEFDHVLLAGLEEGVWPNWQAEQQGAIAEERRLFYVGVTRARHSLQLSGSGTAATGPASRRASWQKSQRA